MGRAPRAATLSPLEPVVNAIAGMRGRYPVYGLVPGLVVDDPRGWTPASELIGGGAALDGFLATAGRRWQAQPHVAAALAWKCYSYWVALPAALGYATAGRVPLPDPDHVLLRWSDEAPFLTVGLHEPPIISGADHSALRASLLDAHMAPLVDRVHERVRLGRRTLLGSLASGIAHGLSRAADSLRGPALPIAETLLSTLDIADLVELTAQPDGRLYVQRRTCCLAFALPEPKICDGCCIARR